MAYVLLRRVGLHPLVYSAFMGALLALAATVLVTFRTRISAHMVGIGGVWGAAVGLHLLFGTWPVALLAALALLAGALGSARLLVGGHTTGQVYGGAVLGLTSTLACVLTHWYL
jgi:hypothetical protein